MLCDTILTWLDMEEGKSKTTSIKDLYQHFSFKEITTNGGLNLIYLDEPLLVKFQDLVGWADAVCIKKRICEHWYEISANDTKIIVSENELIPIYSENDPVTGFHGELKYHYALKNPEKITNDDYIRLICDKRDVFVIPEVKQIEDAVMWSYDVTTKSRFINAGIFHMFATETLSLDEIKAMEKYNGFTRSAK